MQSLPVKVLICIREDFFGRLNELQKAMKYSLGPTQSFRLERFEPEQATEVFCVLAEKEKLGYDRKFIADVTRQELADAEDGLVSPVDIQVLARMIQRQTARESRAFNRSTFQKLGGVEGLLDRYLMSTVGTRETQARRQAAVKVLLVLVDLERNARAGALTLKALRQKLGDEISGDDLEETVAWLARSDVRLISPSWENDEEKFELAHERLIPALRRLAGKQLNDADRANQLLDRRTNEWLGNGRHARYLFSWLELRLINRQRRFITFGKDRQAKEELLAASRRRFRLRFATIGLVALLAVTGWAGWRSNPWQVYLIKRDLRHYGNSVKDYGDLIVLAKAFAYAGDTRSAMQAVGRMSQDNFEGSSALITIAKVALKQRDKEKGIALLSETVKAAEQVRNIDHRAHVLSEVAQSFAKLGVMTKDTALLSEAIKVTGQIQRDDRKSEAQSKIFDSFVELAEITKDRTLLMEAIKTAERAGNDFGKAYGLFLVGRAFVKLGERERAGGLFSEAAKAAEQIRSELIKASALGTLAVSFKELGKKEQANVLLSKAIETAKGIDGDFRRADALGTIAGGLIKLGEREKASVLLSEALEAVERINDGSVKVRALSEVAETLIRLGDKARASAILSEAIKTVPQISLDITRLGALKKVAESIIKLEDREKASILLSEAIEMGERSSDSFTKANDLNEIAEFFIKIGDKEKVISFLSEQLQKAERSSSDSSKHSALSEVAKSFTRFGEIMRDPTLLSKAIKIIEQIPEFYRRTSLSEIARSYARLGATVKDRELLSDAIEITKRFPENTLYNSDKAVVLSTIAVSLIELGENEEANRFLSEAIRITERGGSIITQTEEMSAVIESAVKVAESSNNRAAQGLYDKTFSFVEGLPSDHERDKIFNSIMTSKLAIVDVGKLRSLVSRYGSEAGRAKMLARILMACSRPDLIGKEKGFDDN